MSHITKCSCGSTDFTVIEFLVWKAAVDEDGALCSYTTQENGVEAIQCRKCQKDFQQSDFKTLEWS